MYDSIRVLNDFNRALFSEEKAPMVSIYLPTHRVLPDKQQDLIRYKNLISEAEEGLAQEYKHAEYAILVETLKSLLDDANRDVWKYAKSGMAVLCSGDSLYVYHLDYPVDDIVVVSDSFHVLPLISNFQYGSHYYMLALSANRFDLYHADFHSLEEAPLPAGTKREFSEIYDDFDNQSSVKAGSFGGPEPTYYGSKSKSEVEQIEVEKFFHYVNRIMEDLFTSDSSCPVILVSLPQHQGDFRKIAQFSNLLDEGIDKPFESMSEADVLSQCEAIITEMQNVQIEKRLNDCRAGISKGTASFNLVEIANALAERRVAALFVEEGRLVPGIFNPTTGDLKQFEERNADADDLTDEFARATYLQKGEVYVLPKEVMPAETGVAALFRY